MRRLRIHRETTQLQELVLSELADGGFADKRTDNEAWERALASARTLRRTLDLAHERLKALGCEEGVRGL